MSTDTEAVREAWFAIGGWVAAIAIALWHWRKQIIDAVDWILDRADDLVVMVEGVADDDVAAHPAGYVYVRTPPPPAPPPSTLPERARDQRAVIEARRAEARR